MCIRFVKWRAGLHLAHDIALFSCCLIRDAVWDIFISCNTFVIQGMKRPASDKATYSASIKPWEVRCCSLLLMWVRAAQKYIIISVLLRHSMSGPSPQLAFAYTVRLRLGSGANFIQALNVFFRYRGVLFVSIKWGLCWCANFDSKIVATTLRTVLAFTAKYEMLPTIHRSVCIAACLNHH